MKKNIIISGITILLLLFVSCASTATQEQVDEAFEEVYVEYEENLVLDGAKYYTVKQGDTLSSIAKEFYGADNGYYFPIIMLASADTVLDPDLISPGMELCIPDLNKNIASDAARSKMQSYFKDIADVYKKKPTPSAEKIRTELLQIANSLN